jgi:tetratricopeptide (TPR) repeat protein
MGKLRLAKKKEFDKLHASGMRSLKNGRPEVALKYFEEADTLARHCNDREKRLEVINPIAHCLWSMGEFDKGRKKLALAVKIATELAILDELAIAYSNFGRLESVRIIKRVSVSKQAKALSKESLPYFTKVQKMLAGHDNLYFRYSNAAHGSLVAALAQDYKKAALLSSEGLNIAFKKLSKYNREATYKIKPAGLEYFAIAAKLIELGAKNPNSREYKLLEKAARELVK